MNGGGQYMAAVSPLHDTQVVLLGVPFDGTACFRPGARFGPRAIRFWSDVLETYSRPFDADLQDIKLSDAGDLAVVSADWESASATIRRAVDTILENGASPILMGGEHLVSLPAAEACAARFPDLKVIQLDAHMDLREDYQGLRFSHATVMRRVVDSLGPGRLIQYGIRSGTRDEWAFSEKHGTLAPDPEDFAVLADDGPVYLSVDLDVLDPSIMPETGTPEPGGMTFRELHESLLTLRGLRIVGGDVVEYCPLPGWGGPSGAVAAKVVRELIFLAAENLNR